MLTKAQKEAWLERLADPKKYKRGLWSCVPGIEGSRHMTDCSCAIGQLMHVVAPEKIVEVNKELEHADYWGDLAAKVTNVPYQIAKDTLDDPDGTSIVRDLWMTNDQKGREAVIEMVKSIPTSD